MGHYAILLCFCFRLVSYTLTPTIFFMDYAIENLCNVPYDHYCNIGCKDRRKKGNSKTWLVDLCRDQGISVIKPDTNMQRKSRRKLIKKNSRGSSKEESQRPLKGLFVADTFIFVTALRNRLSSSMLFKSRHKPCKICIGSLTSNPHM